LRSIDASKRRRVMQVGRRLRWVALAGALSFALLSPAAHAGSNNTFKCGSYKGAKKLVSYDIPCMDAEKAVDTWKKECNSARRCVKNVPEINQTFSCKGKKKNGFLRVKCAGKGNQATVRFRVRA
jgi:hypothetical protein